MAMDDLLSTGENELKNKSGSQKKKWQASGYLLKKTLHGAHVKQNIERSAFF